MTENKLIVADQGWAESIPKWILDVISSERMINGMINVMDKGKEEIGDAEVFAYLFTASLRAPLSHNFTEIHLYLTSDLMIRHKGLTKETLPDFLKQHYENGLNEDQKRELETLKSDLIRKRGKVNHPIFELLKQMKGGKF